MRIAFFNPQGNFDPQDLYWTEHADFGGQLVYVKELALAMGELGIEADILTRLIDDPHWPGFSSELDWYPGNPNVRIIRIPFGGPDFLPKEQLWPHLHEYVRGIEAFYGREGLRPTFVTTHYGDGGISGAMFQEQTAIPYSFTAHSLGAQKLEKFEPSPENMENLDRRFQFSKRLTAERITMANAAVHFVSTNQERYEQYSHPYYQGAVDVEDDRRFAVAPPGVNTNVFNPEPGPSDEVVTWRVNEVMRRDLSEERLSYPCIVAASRLDAKKNHIGLVRAYGQSQALQDNANLVITLRGINDPFQDYSRAKPGEKEVLAQIMAAVKEYGLEGKICMFSINSQQELASCYRVFARQRSAFTLTSVYEPFGLAPIEAMACGLPAVVTKNGGPSEVLREGDRHFGVLVDPTSTEDIARGLLDVLGSEKRFTEYQEAGKERVFSTYTWKQTAQRYIDTIEDILRQKEQGRTFAATPIPDFFWTGRGDVTIQWQFESDGGK